MVYTVRVVYRYVRRYFKFLLVGVMNAAVDLGVLNVLLLAFPTRSPLMLMAYNTLGVLAAICNSYLWNRFWTFGDIATGSRREKMKFAIQSLINLVLNDAILVGANDYLVTHRGLPYMLGSNIAKGGAMFVSSSVSYVFMRMFVFRRHDLLHLETRRR